MNYVGMHFPTIEKKVVMVSKHMILYWWFCLVKSRLILFQFWVHFSYHRGDKKVINLKVCLCLWYATDVALLVALPSLQS